MRYFLFRFTRLLCFSLLLTAITVNAEDDKIRIAVSDLLEGPVAETLNTLAEQRSVDLSVEVVGSLPAIDYLRSGKIDLAIVAAPETIELPEGDFETCPFAFDATLIAVNGTNSINEISLSDLKAIFSTGGDQDFNMWGDLAVKDWESRPIKPMASQDDETISLELFKFMVLGGDPMKVTVSEVKDSEIEGLMVSDTAAIGILASPPKNEKIKVLAVSVDSDSPPFGPSNDNVYYGDYPIRMPFKILYNENDLEKLEDTFRILLSNELADVLLANDLYVTPINARRKLMADLNLDE